MKKKFKNVMAFYTSIDDGENTICILINEKIQVCIEQFSRHSNKETVQHIARLIKKWNPSQVIIESNGVGERIISNLKIDFGIQNIISFRNTNNSNEAIIDSLIKLIKQKENNANKTRK